MDEKYVDSFLEKGLLYMNNIEYFRKYEDADIALRGDENEGLSASYRSDQLVIKIDGIDVEGTVGKVDIRHDQEDETNIYSMTKVSDSDILSAGSDGFKLSERFLKFGNRAVVIGGQNIGEFDKRLKNAILSCNCIYTSRADNVFAKQVSYVSQENHHGNMCVFTKFDQYAWQYEWRIALKQISGKGPYSLAIGNLKDISTVFKTEELISQTIELVPKMTCNKSFKRSALRAPA